MLANTGIQLTLRAASGRSYNANNCRILDHPTTKSVYSNVGAELSSANCTAASAPDPSVS